MEGNEVENKAFDIDEFGKQIQAFKDRYILIYKEFERIYKENEYNEQLLKPAIDKIEKVKRTITKEKEKIKENGIPNELTIARAKKDVEDELKRIHFKSESDVEQKQHDNEKKYEDEMRILREQLDNTKKDLCEFINSSISSIDNSAKVVNDGAERFIKAGSVSTPLEKVVDILGKIRSDLTSLKSELNFVDKDRDVTDNTIIDLEVRMIDLDEERQEEGYEYDVTDYRPYYMIKINDILESVEKGREIPTKHNLTEEARGLFKSTILLPDEVRLVTALFDGLLQEKQTDVPVVPVG